MKFGTKRMGTLAAEDRHCSCLWQKALQATPGAPPVRQLASMMHHHGSGSVTWLVSQDWMCSVTARPASSWSHCQAGTVASVRFCRWKDQPTKVARGGGTESYDPPPDLLRPDVLVPASSGIFMACRGSPSEPAATLLSPGSTSRM